MTLQSSTAPLSIAAGDVTLSGRITQPDGISRGLIVALHGGTYDSGYYSIGPDSLLSVGAQRGFTVVALDRPGYGGSVDVDPVHTSFAGQTAILAAAVDRLAQAHPGPVAIVGHSIGGMLALRTAAATATQPVAVEVSGLGELWQPGLLEMWSSLIGDAPSVSLPPEGHAQVMFGAQGTYAASAPAEDADLLRPLPMPELIDVVTWSDQLPAVARAVAAPVSLTLAEQDNIWQSDDAARAALARHFTGSADVRVELFTGAGHSIELHHRAGDYVERQLAFIEELVPA